MKTDKNTYLAIGSVGSAVGIKGEFKVNLYSADSANLREGKILLFRHAKERAGVENDAEEFETVCKSVRYQKDKPVINVEGIEDRNSAEVLIGMDVCISESELEELPEGEHYIRNLIGCTVRDIASGKDIGILTDVIQNTAQSVLEVGTAGGKPVLIPAVDAFMRNIDEERRLIEVELIPGFTD